MQNTMDSIFTHIEQLLSANAVVLFMKGDKHMPACGFSQAVVQILLELNVQFQDVNVLLDDNIRQGIKKYSQWPTIPQLYVNKKFIGGHDIIVAMKKAGELTEVFKDLIVSG